MNILITGSSGFIGTNLFLYLKNKKNKIFLLDRKKNQYLATKNFYQFDLKNIKKIEELCLKKKIDTVIHLAAVSGVKPCHENPLKAFKDNIVSTFNLLNVSKKLGIKKILLASSFSVNNFYSAPSYYGYTKHTVENMAYSFKKNFKTNVSILRFSNVFGSFSKHKISAVHNFIKNSLLNKPLDVHGSGKQSRDFIHVLDIVKKINNIIESKNMKLNYNLNTNIKTNLITIVNTINKISKKNNKINFIKTPAGYDTTPDTIKVKKNINKKLYNSLQKTYNWYRNN